MPKVDWTKPIERRWGGKTYPARFLGIVKQSCPCAVAYLVEGNIETISQYKEDGSCGGPQIIFNVEPPKKKITVNVDIYKTATGRIIGKSAIDAAVEADTSWTKLASHSFELEVSVAESST